MIGLVGAQLGAGRARDDAFGDGALACAVRVVLVAPLAEFENRRFCQIFDHSKATSHIAIECAVARGHFAFVAGGQHNRAEFIRQRHEQCATNAGLDVFFCRIFSAAFEFTSERGFEGFKHRENRNFVVAHI